MTKILIDTFHGGIAQDTRDFTTTEAVSGGNFEVTKTKLSPYRPMVRHSNDSAEINKNISDWIVDETTGYVLSTGQDTTVSAFMALYAKDSSSDITKSYQKESVSTATHIKNTLLMYKGKPYALGKDGSGNFRLIKWGGYATPTAVLTGSSSTLTPRYVPKPVVHPEDNILYGAYGNIVFTWNDTTANTTALVLPVDREITSLRPYEGYLAIATRSLTSYGKSITYLWGRDTSLSTLQGSIDFGTGDLLILTLINNTLLGISYEGYNPLSSNLKRKMIIRGYDGGSAVKLKEIQLSDTEDITNHRVENNNKCFFSSSQNTDAIWSLGKNIDGKLTIDKNRYILNGEKIQTIYSFGLVGDYLFVSVSDPIATSNEQRIYQTDNVNILYGDGYREFLVNHGMTHEDRPNKKKLNRVFVYWESVGTSSTISLNYKLDSTAYAQALTDTGKTAGIYVTEASRPTSASSFESGRDIQLKVNSTSGAKIIGVGYEYTNQDTNK